MSVRAVNAYSCRRIMNYVRKNLFQIISILLTCFYDIRQPTQVGHVYEFINVKVQFKYLKT